MFLYFVAEIALAIFAISKYDVREDIRHCNSEADFDGIAFVARKKRKYSLWLFAILLLLSAFQSFDYFMACSPICDSQTLLGQNADNVFTGVLCFANVALVIVCVVFIVKIIAENVTNVIDVQLRDRISKARTVDSELANMEKSYGKVSDIIRINNDVTVLSNAIIRFDVSQILYCLGQLIPYKEIVKCEGSSLPIHKTATRTVTKTSISSVLRRAVIGGVIAGPIGAVIGGATGKKKSETFREDVPMGHEHKAVITLKNTHVITIPIACVNYKVSENKYIHLSGQEAVFRITDMINIAIDIKNEAHLKSLRHDC